MLTSQIRKINRQMKKMEKTNMKIGKNVEKLQNDIVLSQGKLEELQEDYRKLGIMLNIEFKKVQRGIIEINKKMNRSFRILTNAVNYRYDKNKDLNQEVKEEMNELIRYINARLEGKEKIKKIKINIKKMEEKIGDLQKTIPLKQNELNLNMAKMNEVNMQYQQLGQEKEELREKIKDMKLEMQQRIMTRRVMMGAGKRKASKKIKKRK